jgi:hypothetical protein
LQGVEFGLRLHRGQRVVPVRGNEEATVVQLPVGMVGTAETLETVETV